MEKRSVAFFATTQIALSDFACNCRRNSDIFSDTDGVHQKLLQNGATRIGSRAGTVLCMAQVEVPLSGTNKAAAELVETARRGLTHTIGSEQWHRLPIGIS